MRLRILAIDLGSSKTELVLYDRKLALLDRAAFATSFDQIDGVKTLDAERFIEELLEAAAGLRASPRPGGGRGPEETLYVSTTGMGSTVMAVGAAGAGGLKARPPALSPVLSWETALPGPAGPAGGWEAVPLGSTGKTPLPTYPLYKIPELMRRHGRGSRFVSLHDFIWAQLSGSDAYITDYSLASRSLLFDDIARGWDAGILGQLGLGPDSLPAAVPAGTMLGRVRADLRRRLGWPADSFVFAGMHDHLATALTGLRLARACCGAVSTPVPADENFLVNPAGTTESLMAVVGRSAGSDPILVRGAPGRRLNTESGWDESVLALVCYPCLSGEVLLAAAGRAIDAEACLVGLKRVMVTPPRRRLALDDPGFVESRGDGPAGFSDIMAARVAAVQFELKSGLSDMRAALAGAGLPADPRGIICLGGQARQAWLGRLKAAVLGLPVFSLAGENCAALGLALRFMEKNFPTAPCSGRPRGRAALRIEELAGRMERYDPEAGLVQAFEAAYGDYERTTAQWGKHR